MVEPRPSIFKRLSEAVNEWTRSNPSYDEIFRAVLRLILAMATVLMFISIGGYYFETVDTRKIVADAREMFFLLKFIPKGVEEFFVFVFYPSNLRYAFPPLAAMGLVFITGAYFVRDIYHLRNLRHSLHYVISSMLGIFYPRLSIDNGKMKLAPKEVNLLDDIGGPGFIMIQPGNVVMFRKLRESLQPKLTTSFMMARFEMIGQIASLDDQHGYVDNIEVMTRDGIRIVVRDINYRYMIESVKNKGQRPIGRSQNQPYPFDDEAINRMAYNLPVNENGQFSWEEYVRLQVTRAIENYINSHTVDHLTAPRNGTQDPRAEIRATIFSPEVGEILSGNGTRMLWVDVGHFDIVESEVDKERIGVWAAEWIGNAAVEKAFGEAKRMAWQEQGRAEGQAEMIVGIAEALREVPMTGDRNKNLRAILLARVIQVLDAMRDTRPIDES